MKGIRAIAAAIGVAAMGMARARHRPKAWQTATR